MENWFWNWFNRILVSWRGNWQWRKWRFPNYLRLSSKNIILSSCHSIFNRHGSTDYKMTLWRVDLATSKFTTEKTKIDIQQQGYCNVAAGSLQLAQIILQANPGNFHLHTNITYACSNPFRIIACLTNQIIKNHISTGQSNWKKNFNRWLDYSKLLFTTT